MTSTKGEMDAHAAKVQGGTQQIPGENQGKVSQGQAKVNAEATKEPEKPKGLWGHIVSAAKWVAEKLKAAFEFVTQLLTDPGFWVSLVVAIALTAFVIATFGTGLAAIAIGGVIVGAISAGAGQITSNLAAGKKWNEGLGTAMLVGGAFGLIPGAGKVLGSIGTKVASKVGAKVAASAFGRSVVGRGLATAGRGLANVVSKGAGKAKGLGSKIANSKVGKAVSYPFRKIANAGTRAGEATRSSAKYVRGRVRTGTRNVTDRAKSVIRPPKDMPPDVHKVREGLGGKARRELDARWRDSTRRRRQGGKARRTSSARSSSASSRRTAATSKRASSSPVTAHTICPRVPPGRSSTRRRRPRRARAPGPRRT